VLTQSIRSITLASPFLFLSSTLLAQNANTPQAGPIDSTPPAVQQAPPPSPLPFAFSGVLYLNYQYGGPTTNQSANRFDVDRAYLNFRAGAGSRDSIRVTVDVSSSATRRSMTSTPGGAVRIKYAFLSHQFVGAGPSTTRLFGRIGILQTVIIDKEEQYWNRGLSQAAVELAGYFSSADAGAAMSVGLPNRLGEIYATVVNGNGYTSRETDRFKDYQARVSLSPFANSSGLLRGLEFSPWVSIGGRASDFLAGQGTLTPVTDQQRRIGSDCSPATAPRVWWPGCNWDGRSMSPNRRHHGGARADHEDRHGNLLSAFAFVRPLGPASQSPWSLLFRVDNVEPDDSKSGNQRRYIAGTTWDFSTRTSVTFDVQTLSFLNGLSGTNTRTYFLHFIANF
jgi:hypothetical protein